MFITFKNSIISLLLVIAISLSTWSIFLSKQWAPASTDALSHRPDAFMEDVIATIINKEGNPVLKVAAPKMIHYADNDSTDMTAPNITVFRKESPNPWFINADFAKATQGISQILFQKNVVIHHPANIDNPTTTMSTDSLTVFPDEQTAQTNDPILITQPSSTIHAVGMHANLKDGTVKLLSQAREEYVPNS